MTFVRAEPFGKFRTAQGAVESKRGFESGL